MNVALVTNLMSLFLPTLSQVNTDAHVPCVMLRSLPTARLHTLPLTLGGMPCHQRSLTRRDVHLEEGLNVERGSISEFKLLH